LSEASSMSEVTAGPARGFVATLSRNAAASVARLFIASLVALVLPAYLTRYLPVQTYGAWVLVLQLSAYVSYLDFGVQSGVSKYVAEYVAKDDYAGAERSASTGFVIMLAASVLGVLLTLILAYRVPQLFQSMPVALYRDVRISVVLIGISLAIGLACSVFSAIFLGLQLYVVPMTISIINRVLFTVVVCLAVFLHSSLAVMGGAVAAVNVSTVFLQIVAWRKLASRIRVRLSGVNRDALKQMLSFCFVLAVWSAGMFCISGLDITVVGHYAFNKTGYYATAALPSNVVALILSALMGPLMPAASALSTQRSRVEMGDILYRATRYSSILLFSAGLPLLVCSYPILRLWVGPDYAAHAVPYMRILTLGITLRNFCLPYATMVVATGKQRFATAATISEAVVNLAGSIYLARFMGATGVALGTLLGAFVSVAMHFVLSMHYTSESLAISRRRLLLQGLLRPAISAVPSALLLPLWWSSTSPRFSLQVWLIWTLSTLLLTWFASLNLNERDSLLRVARGRLRLSVSHT